MLEPAKAVQTPQPLRQCAYAACLRHQVFGVDVCAYFKRLRGDNDQVAITRSPGITGRWHAVDRIQDELAGSFGLTLSCSPRQQDDIARMVEALWCP